MKKSKKSKETGCILKLMIVCVVLSAIMLVVITYDKLPDFINNEITVMVATKGDRVFEYIGTLSTVEEDSIVLKNVKITLVADEWTKKHALKSGLLYYADEILEETIINKKYIISYIKK